MSPQHLEAMFNDSNPIITKRKLKRNKSKRDKKGMILRQN